MNQYQLNLFLRLLWKEYLRTKDGFYLTLSEILATELK